MPDPPGAQDVFHFDSDRASFDDLALENGQRYWSSSQLMRLLGYSDRGSFQQVINKACTACMTIGAGVTEHFQDQAGGDRRLSRFACYLVAMNGDPRKPEVAYAQAYFAAIADAFQKYIRGSEDVQRVEVRQRVTDSVKSLHSAASNHGVQNYAFFQDKGYRGLYNMSLSDLRKYKSDPSKGKRPLLDYMDRRELAANLFRLAETEARIEQGDLQGQVALEHAAHRVGKSVRETMMEDGGQAPENLPLAPDIKNVKHDLKRTVKGLGDGKKGGKGKKP